MKAVWLILILWTFNLTALSQYEKCFQTVQVKCGDTIADYLTVKEKKNLFKLQVKFEQLRSEVEYLREVGKVDSLHITKLEGYLKSMDSNIDLCEAANDNYKQAYNELNKANKLLSKQLRITKAKGIIGGVGAALGAFGAGVGVTFTILKLAK